jgi:IS6 family transposase
MSDPSLFQWRHFQADIILCAVRWYLRYALSYRDVEELLQERGVQADHTTVFHWVQRYAPSWTSAVGRSSTSRMIPTE